MIPGDQKSREASRRRLVLAVVLVLAGVVVGIFGLLFVMVNDAWTVVHIPSAPWSAEASWSAFEARLAAIVLVSFTAGALAMAVLGRLLGRRLRRRLGRATADRDALRGELENVRRLLASARDKS